MSDLFTIEESLSPRLAWMQKHGITAMQSESGPWTAWSSLIQGRTAQNLGFGDSEDEAITQWALKLGISLWNEEGRGQ
jgi:hypothetical protein